MIEKEKIISHIKRQREMYSFLSFILTLLMVVLYAWERGVFAKMLLDILIIAVIVILFFGAIISFIRWVQRPWKDRLKKKEEEIGTLKSELDELVEQVKPPKTFNKAITVEISPKWGKAHPSNIVVVHNPGDTFPSLYFDMRVVNRTYFSFEAEEIEINCFCGEETVYRGTWNKKIGQPKPDAFDKFYDLPKFGDGIIEFHILLTKLYNNLEKWNLEGSAKYRLREPLIEDDTQYTNPERDIHLEYVLSEKQISKLKKEVEKALGDDI